MRCSTFVLLALLPGFCPADNVNVPRDVALGRLLEPVAWDLSGSSLRCSLQRELAGFGRIAFEREASASLHLKLAAVPEMQRHSAHVVALTPAWHPQHPQEQPPVLARPGADAADSIRDPAASALREALLNGWLLRIDVQTPSGHVRQAATVTSAGFVPAERALRGCEGELIAHGFAELERTSLNFAAGSSAIDAAGRSLLARVQTYVRVDPLVRKVFVEGHSDGAGAEATRRNIAMARARAVAAHLVAAGVPADRIVERGHGSRFPVAADTTPQGRARNRRVTVRIERGPEGDASTQLAAPIASVASPPEASEPARLPTGVPTTPPSKEMTPAARAATPAAPGAVPDPDVSPGPSMPSSAETQRP